ncbi:MAG: hypothetical protein K9G33_09435 [Sneathiella sp.]|nr:hypothetical protein [Sneathiella sp.]
MTSTVFRLHRPVQLPAIALLILAAVFLYGRTAQASDAFSFLAISDVPYTARENYTLEQLVAPAVTRSKLPFVIYMGDFKNGGLPCTAALMTESRNRIMALHPGRVFYTPGDNDWTDCDRAEIRQRFSELDRLDLLRRLFYGAPMELPVTWFYARQSLFPENMRWVYENVVFATIHMVSTNNGRDEILLDDVDLALTLTDARDRANILWLEAAFAEAEKLGASAVIIATQADVTQFHYSVPCTIDLRQKCDGFATVKQVLSLLAANFKKPVLLMHGDTHLYCLDKGFGGAVAPNLWRFNSTGDYSFVDAAEITVDAANTAAPFSFVSLTRRKKPQDGC